MSAAGSLERRWSAIRERVEIADVGFFLLRVAALVGTIGWLSLAEMPAASARAFFWISLYFIAYNVVLYLLIFLAPARKAKTRCVRAEKLGDCRKCEFYDRVLVRQDL